MADEVIEEKTVSNVISDETGQYDVRFLLWRQFCSDNNLVVETLPSELSDDLRQKWEQLKSDQLNNR